ncbi:MAG: RNA methyltransferase [Clostridia bacterium]|nr:RNA methyltransferase [Clostridia bacterium]
MATIIPVETLDTPELNVYLKLTGAQLRNRLNPEDGLFIAESPMVIDVALKAGCVPVSVLTEDRLINSDVHAILDRCPGIPAYTAPRGLLKELTGFELTRGMLCAMRRPPDRTAESVCRDATRIAVLEGIVDSTNLGAIFRSAAALGIDAVLLSPDCCDPLCRRSLRVSMGTVLLIPWARIGPERDAWPHPGIDSLRRSGFLTVAMALREDAAAPDAILAEKPEKIALILGNEGAGLKPETIESSDAVLRIPMSHGVDSLNVGAAAAIAFWEFRKR